MILLKQLDSVSHDPLAVRKPAKVRIVQVLVVFMFSYDDQGIVLSSRVCHDVPDSILQYMSNSNVSIETILFQSLSKMLCETSYFYYFSFDCHNLVRAA